MRKLPLWSVRLERDKLRQTEFVAAETAEAAMTAAKNAGQGFEVVGVQRVQRIALVAIDTVLVGD